MLRGILNKTAVGAILSVLVIAPSFSQTAANRYALILDDPPVQTRFSSRAALQMAEARDYRQQIEQRQSALRTTLATRNIRVAASATTLLNAIFVTAPADRMAELQALPGVKAVVPVRRYKHNLNRATQLLDAPGAWSSLGGMDRAGNGIKIAILDTGIDQTHPAFQDSTLPMPSGYPICNGSDCAFTNNKVIVARSYVPQLAAGSDASNPAADSRPDDYSPRDRDGHGTAVASCAAANTASGTVTITGMAPKAYLGNYKIYGSPEVNDSVPDDVIIAALEDAIKDGMDVVSFSSGGPALTGPLDSGGACGNPAGVPCDLSAQAFEAAAEAGLVIVSAGGNEGLNGLITPTFNTVGSPADAPAVIAAGATTNSHSFAETLSVPGVGSFQGIVTLTGDALIPQGAITAPLIDVVQLGDNGLACASLPPLSLAGSFAFIQTGTCNLAAKVASAASAGAIGVILYSATSAASAPRGLASSFVPAAEITSSQGLALKAILSASPGHPVTVDPSGIERAQAPFNEVASFSSIGPSTGDYLIKPDLVAVGTNVYMAAENYDPLGILYSSTRFATADGTSFSTPLTSGAAALVKQAHPHFTAGQIKSALVNTATQDVTTDDAGNPVDVQWLGGGKLDAGAAVHATVTSEPATISFGVPTSLPLKRQIKLTNAGSSAATLSLAVNVTKASPGAAVAIDTSSLTLAPGVAATVTMTLSGTLPAAGSYSGAIAVQGSGASLRIPYWYLEGDGQATNLIPLTGDQNDGTAGQPIPDGQISFELIDNYGVPVSGAPVTWSSRNGIRLQSPDSVTNRYGIASAQAILGSSPGTQTVTAAGGGLRYTFVEAARLAPSISPGAVLNGASFDSSQPIAPGSFVSIFGVGLSDLTDYASTPILPLAIDFARVSFDVPSTHLSVPGHLTYVSSGQVNLQVPWELAGQTSAQVKVSIDSSYGNVITVPIADYSPAFFEAGGNVAALDASNRHIGPNPALRGQTIQLFANGLGPVTNQPASGDPAPSSPLARTTTQPVVTIGSQTAEVSFSGLAPGFAGLYQINVIVPVALSPGTYPVNVKIGGQTSKNSSITVQ